MRWCAFFSCCANFTGGRGNVHVRCPLAFEGIHMQAVPESEAASAPPSSRELRRRRRARRTSATDRAASPQAVKKKARSEHGDSDTSGRDRRIHEVDVTVHADAECWVLRTFHGGTGGSISVIQGQYGSRWSLVSVLWPCKRSGYVPSCVLTPQRTLSRSVQVAPPQAPLRGHATSHSVPSAAPGSTASYVPVTHTLVLRPRACRLLPEPHWGFLATEACVRRWQDAARSRIPIPRVPGQGTRCSTARWPRSPVVLPKHMRLNASRNAGGATPADPTPVVSSADDDTPMPDRDHQGLDEDYAPETREAKGARATESWVPRPRKAQATGSHAWEAHVAESMPWTAPAAVVDPVRAGKKAGRREEGHVLKVALMRWGSVPQPVKLALLCEAWQLASQLWAKGAARGLVDGLAWLPIPEGNTEASGHATLCAMCFRLHKNDRRNCRACHAMHAHNNLLWRNACKAAGRPLSRGRRGRRVTPLQVRQLLASRLQRARIHFADHAWALLSPDQRVDLVQHRAPTHEASASVPQLQVSPEERHAIGLEVLRGAFNSVGIPEAECVTPQLRHLFLQGHRRCVGLCGCVTQTFVETAIMFPPDREDVNSGFSRWCRDCIDGAAKGLVGHSYGDFAALVTPSTVV